MLGAQVLTKGNRGVLLLALFFGLVSAALIYAYLKANVGDGGGQLSGPVQKVVVAKQDIPAGTKVTVDMIELKDIPESLVLPNGFLNTEEVVGQVTTVSLTAGEQIVATRLSATGVDLAQFGDNPPLSLVVPAGMRAFSIRVSEVSAAGGLIRPGDYVDVVATREVPLGQVVPDTPEAVAQATVTVACYVVQDVQVLAISQDVQTSVAPAGGSGSGAGGGQSEPNPESASATLAVTTQQAWQLAAAQGSVTETSVDTQLWLALRPYGERGVDTALPQCTFVQG